MGGGQTYESGKSGFHKPEPADPQSGKSELVDQLSVGPADNENFPGPLCGSLESLTVHAEQDVSPALHQSRSSAVENQAAESGGTTASAHPSHANDDVSTAQSDFRTSVNAGIFVVSEHAVRLNENKQANILPRGTRLYNLMQISSDKQDLSFVEKVMLPQSDIFDLCNRVVPDSARAVGHDKHQHLSFSQLNKSSLRFVGFYGNKSVMMEIFRAHGVVDPDTLSRMRKDELRPGLHAALHEKTLHIFYWHPGQSSLSVASRRDISCNFIRYLVELCDIVHICLESSGLEPLISASKSTLSKKKRTQRLKISVVKASENDLKFLPGFQVSLPFPKSTGVPRDVQGFQLTEGFHRAAVLIATDRPPKMSLQTYQEIVKLQDIPQVVVNWRTNYDLNISELENKDFILLLECAQMEEYTGLCTLKEDLKKKQAEQAEKVYELDALVSSEEARVVEIFARGVSAYIKLHFAWEEALLTEGYSEITSPANEAQEGDPHVASSLVQQSGDVDDCLPALKDSSTKDMNSNVTILEREMCEIWTGSQEYGTPGVKELIFGGSEIGFKDWNNVLEYYLPTAAGGLPSKKYSIHYFEWTSTFKKFGPILYDEDYLLKPIGRSTNSQTIRFLTTNEVCSVGPVLTCQPLYLILKATRGQYGHSTEERILISGLIVHKRPRSDPMDMWMESFSCVTMSPLQKKASLIDFCLDKFRKVAAVGSEFSLDPEENLLIQAMVSDHIDQYSRSTNPPKRLVAYLKNEWKDLQLIQAMVSDHFDQYSRSTNLPKRLVTYLKNEWEDLQKELPVEAMSTTISPAVRSTCGEIHRDGRSLFHQKVSIMVKSTIVPLLKEKIKADQKLQTKALEEQAKLQESEYISNLRKDFTTRKEDVPTLSIRSCKNHEKQDNFLSAFTRHLQPGQQHVSKGTSLSISYSKKVAEKENLTWKVSELLPMKRDLDALITNAGQMLAPKVQLPVKLIDLDSRESRLSKVVYLRSGQLLVFVEQFVGEPLLTIYLCPKLGVDLTWANPKVTFKRTVDMVAFDEGSKFMALYVRSTATIQINYFDDTFAHMEWTGIQTSLKEYTGNENIIWMRFVPGKAELALIDSLNCIRLLELTQTPMFRARQIELPFPFTKACISADGSCLIVVHKIVKPGSSQNVPMENEVSNKDSARAVAEATKFQDDGGKVLMFEVYWLETMVHLKSQVESDITVGDIDNLEASVVTFGTQMHLLIHDGVKPSLICSMVLESSSASEVCEMKVRNSTLGTLTDISNASPESSERSCPELDFVYHIFDKYSTSPPLKTEDPASARPKKRHIHLIILLKGLHESQSDLGAKCESYIKGGLEKLRTEKGKDFSELAIRVQSRPLKTWLTSSSGTLQAAVDESNLIHGNLVPMGTWIQLLVCLVPVQIARAENNGLKPLVDGLQIPSHLNYADALSLADIIRFGFYESFLESWVGEIKVVSSMGKQSSGKSYLLNHLSGSLLDVAGGRCTDGVWMTMRATKECLYILLDFEGLGSFERSEQEDMLLSIFNAAVSNITIFNKKDFHLDKETEAVFEKFQSGVSLVKEDDKLFQGLFYIAIKDVDTSDVEDLKDEFQEKIAQICSKSQQNFLMRMYGGEVEIAAMPPFQRPEYQESIKEIALTVRELSSCHQNGLSFMRDLKLVLAQISAKDWSSIDSKRVAYKICLLRRHWETAIFSGCLAVEDDGTAELINFDTREAIDELAPLKLAENTFHLLDTGVQLAPLENQVIGFILEPIRTAFQQVVPRKGENDEAWHSSFESFLSALADRRKQRVLDWISVNIVDFEEDGDVQKLRLEALAILAEHQQRLSLCSCKCQRCFLRCIQERNHPGDHSCRSTHRCTQTCTYCTDDTVTSPGGGTVSGCNDVAGHEGPHDCQERAHTCGLDCSYSGQASNCNKVCTLKAIHAGEHKCNSRQHMCQKSCSLPGCKNPCVIPFDLGDHDHHACHEKMCPEKCTIQGCNRNCASIDHFHAQIPGLTHHFCGNEHPCYQKCEAPGICEVLTEVVKKTRTYQGKRATFEYEHVSEQNGVRKTCCIAIPPFQESHQGLHSHTSTNNAVHFCETRCQACGYFCNLPIGHDGLHSTNHGNMRDVSFVSEAEDINILDRKYTWGESGLAEMCMMHCKNQGRGHIHLIPCLTHNGGMCAAKLIEGARHETCKYGPDFHIPKDELTHAAFWKHIRFKDPCSEGDQRLFALCNHHCRSSEHSVASGSAIAGTTSQQTSYCVEALWHTAVSRTGLQTSGAGYITDDGHRFSCNHSKDVENHVIFVIDRSGSMSFGDCIPTLLKFTARHRNRLGCVYEAILRFIRARQARAIQDSVSVVLFDTRATVAFEGQPIAEALVDQLLPHQPGGLTNYSCGIEVAKSILFRCSTNPLKQKQSPAVIFLSDGGNNDGGDPVNLVRRMKQVEPKLVLHTIKFGHDSHNQILKDMANAGSGSFQVSLDEVELAKSFEGLARSLKHQVSALM